jgi:hypothetical protein
VVIVNIIRKSDLERLRKALGVHKIITGSDV